MTDWPQIVRQYGPLVLAAAGQFAGIRARWSPDGRRVAFTCRKYAPNHPRRFGVEAYLQIVQADGTGLETLIREHAQPNAITMELTAWR
jgi:hypothetical protein